jgi:hypothetical protein
MGKLNSSLLSWGGSSIFERYLRLVLQNILLIRSEYLSSPPVFSGIHVARSLVFWVVFSRSLFVLISFFLSHCVVCPSSIYGFCLPHWYLQTLLNTLFYPFINHLKCERNCNYWRRFIEPRFCFGYIEFGQTSICQ